MELAAWRPRKQIVEISLNDSPDGFGMAGKRVDGWQPGIGG